jgi:cytochrome c biogenesis protein CcdA
LRGLMSAAADSVRQAIQDAVRKGVLIAVALILLTIAVVFCELALFLWLRTLIKPYYAALAVAGVTLVIVLILLLVAFAGRSRTPRKQPASRLQAAADAPPAGDPLARLATDAEALGMAFARDVKGYQLALGAFVVGMLLGRGRR